MHKNILKNSITILIILCSSGISFAEFPNAKVRQTAINFMQDNEDLSVHLSKPVEVRQDKTGVLQIKDPGSYIVQYMLLTPDSKQVTDPNISINLGMGIPQTCDKAVIVTHGWIDKGRDDWPADIAAALHEKTDPNEWIVSYFDWQTGAVAINATDAARYSRDIAGVRLAKAFLAVLNPDKKLRHLHLIAHSAGTWAASTAADIIAKETGAQIHLTLLDAYVPPKWDEAQLGKIKSEKPIYAEHYYTKDITMKVTQKNLPAAHNVDISDAEPVINTHEFPYRWYYATITGKFREKDSFKNKDVITKHGKIEYGFARSLESSPENFKKSLNLKKANKAIKIKKTKKQSILNPATWFKKKDKK